MEKLNAVILLATFSTLLIQSEGSHGSANCIGCEKPVNLTEDEEARLVNLCAEGYNIMSELQHNVGASPKPFKLVGLANKAEQVTQGTKYRLKLSLQKHDRPKPLFAADSLEDSMSTEPGKILYCEVLVSPSGNELQANLKSWEVSK